ncbi:MAG: holo-ACP synthase [Planctomycetaceae bacterium]|nr:holo-ACP synthase [Planctomycetaceae bacterium]
MDTIFGIGIDIVSIARITAMREKQGEKALSVVFLPSELEYCRARVNTDESLAARFAAKEAVMKALGTGWAQGVAFTGIEVVREGENVPEIRLHGPTADKAKALGAGRIHCSLSHGGGMAIAEALIEKAWN